jgi:nicotinate dehydrogenase subunit B
MALDERRVDGDTADSAGHGITRKEFLFGAGALVVTFSAAGQILEQVAQAAGSPAVSPWVAPALGYLGGPTPVGSFLAITASGQIMVSQSQPDVGTGAQTGMLQIVADELYVPFEMVSMMPASTMSGNDGGVGGSQGVHAGGAVLRLAAATARENLKSLAATALGVSTSQLKLANGTITAPNGKSVTYGQLVKGKQLQGTINPAVPLKPTSEYTVVGTSVPRIDIPAKLTATKSAMDYLVNVRVPGMVHARLVRPPAYGAQIIAYDRGAAMKVPGVTHVVPLDFDPDHMSGWDVGFINTLEMGQFLAVVAKTEQAAIDGSLALAQTVKWTAGTAQIPQPASNTYGYLMSLPEFSRSVAAQRGSMVGAFAGAAKTLEAEYSTPYLANAPIGPSTGLAQYQGGKATIWSDSQSPYNTQTQAAALLGVPAANVTVYSFPGSGVYGRGWNDDAAYEALLISRAIGGLPVRVQWMRGEEFQWSTMQGPKYFRLKGALDGTGKMTALQFDVWTDKDFADGWVGQTGIAITPQYTIPHLSQVIHYVQNPMRKGLLRAVAGPSNCFAVESFVDEAAALAGVDPLQYRIGQLADPRAVALLKQMGKAAGWKTHTKPSGRGMGVAHFFDPGSGTYAAAIAEVSVDTKTGAVKANRIYSGFDCGLVVNPNGVQLQMEGGTIQSASWALKESVKYANGMVTTVDWISYPILHFTEVPEVVTVLTSHPEYPPGGVGELATLPTAAALANAIYDATGARVRAWPLQGPNLLQALAKV